MLALSTCGTIFVIMVRIEPKWRAQIDAPWSVSFSQKIEFRNFLGCLMIPRLNENIGSYLPN
jgi:hypothetical protein